jgi:hypothetical protein
VFPHGVELFYDLLPFCLAALCAFMGWYELPKAIKRFPDDAQSLKKKSRHGCAGERSSLSSAASQKFCSRDNQRQRAAALIPAFTKGRHPPIPHKKSRSRGA